MKQSINLLNLLSSKNISKRISLQTIIRYLKQMKLNKQPNKRLEVQAEIDVKDIVVIDSGTDTVKVGISGTDYPEIIIDSITGRVELNPDSDLMPSKNFFFGEHLIKELENKKYPIRLSEPIQQGCIKDKSMDDIAELWLYLLQLLKIEPTNAHLLLIDSPVNQREYKSKLASVVFQKMKAASLLFMDSSSLSLFATGATTGFVVELGHGLTTVAPIFEGFVLPHALQKSNVSGKQITETLIKQIKQQGIPIKWGSKEDPLSVIDQIHIIRSIKQNMCKVAFDYKNTVSSQDKRQTQQKSFELPDGTVIQVSLEATYKPSQILFNPNIINSNMMSVQEMMRDSLSRCDSELQNQMVKNTVVCGGTSLLTGIKERLEKQFENEPNKHNFVLDWQRRYSGWIGGSMIGSLSTYQNLAIQKQEYQDPQIENKSSIIFKKCF